MRLPTASCFLGLAAAFLLAVSCAPEGPAEPLVGGHAGSGGGIGGSGGGGAGGVGGSAGTGGSAGVASPVPTINPVALTVQPGAGRAFLADAIRGSVRSVRVVSYLLTDDGIEDALAEAAGRGVVVRVIVEGSQPSNNEARTRLDGAGCQVREGAPEFALTHEKAAVVDDDLAFVLTQNLTRAGFETNREFGVSFTGQAAAELASIFDADWERAGFNARTTLVVSPINSRERIEALLRAATTEILVEMEVLNDSRAIDLLAARAREGIRVRLVLEDPSDVTDHVETARTLQASGADVRWMSSPEVHAKAIVIDRSLAYVGSVNLTFSSMDRNREIGVVTDHAATVDRIASTIEQDLAGARTDF